MVMGVIPQCLDKSDSCGGVEGEELSCGFHDGNVIVDKSSELVAEVDKCLFGVVDGLYVSIFERFAARGLAGGHSRTRLGFSFSTVLRIGVMRVQNSSSVILSSSVMPTKWQQA